jgi:hypothetical protein
LPSLELPKLELPSLELPSPVLDCSLTGVLSQKVENAFDYAIVPARVPTRGEFGGRTPVARKLVESLALNLDADRCKTGAGCPIGDQICTDQL